MDAITQAGASGIFVEVKWLLLWILFGRCGVRDSSLFVYVLFRGVGLLGVFSKPRGVAETFEGVRTALDCFVGVDGADPERDGVPGADIFSVRFGLDMLNVRSRKE